MKSKVSCKSTRNILRPSTPEKRSTEKKHRKKDCQKMMDSKVYACLDTDLSEVLHHHVII